MLVDQQIALALSGNRATLASFVEATGNGSPPPPLKLYHPGGSNKLLYYFLVTRSVSAWNKEVAHTEVETLL